MARGNVPAQAPKGAGPLLLAAATQLACDWLGSRKAFSASKPRLSGQAAQSSAGTELPRLKLSREPGRESFTGQGSGTFLYKVPQPQGAPVQCRDLSSGRVGKRSRRAEALYCGTAKVGRRHIAGRAQPNPVWRSAFAFRLE